MLLSPGQTRDTEWDSGARFAKRGNQHPGGSFSKLHGMKIFCMGAVLGGLLLVSVPSQAQDKPKKPEPKRMTYALRNISPLLQVKSLDASLEFYTRKLGFQEYFKEEGGFAMVGRDLCVLFLAEKQVPVDLRNIGARANADGFASYDLHFNLSPDTADALYKEFRDAGVTMPPEFEKGPVNRPYGIRDFSILDPDGYSIVFGAPLEKSAAHQGNAIDIVNAAGKLTVEGANLAKANFKDVNLEGTVFDDINLSGASFNNINLSGAKFNDINLKDAKFNEINLSKAIFSNCDLSGVSFTNCKIDGMTINGVAISDLPRKAQ